MNKKWISGILMFTLLFGAVGFVSLPVQAAPVQEDVIFDDMVDGETLYDAELSTVDNIGFTTSAQKNVFDTTRMFKKSHDNDEQDKNSYFTYVSEGYAMTKIRLRAAFCKNGSGVYADGFRFETSENGDVFSELEYSQEFTVYGGDNWKNNFWGEGVLEIDNLPENTHYLRIYFPSTKELAISNTYTQIGSVAITTTQPPVLALKTRVAEAEKFYTSVCNGDVPALYSYAKARALSEALTAANAVADDANYETVCTALETLEGTLQEFVNSIEGTPTTFLDECNDLEATTIDRSGVNFKTPKDFTNLEDSTGEKGDSVFSADATMGGYFVYEVDAAKTISNLILETAYSQSAQGTLLGDPIVKAAPAAASAEEAVFAELPYTKEFLGNITGSWDHFRLTVPVVPEGTKYIRVEFPDLGNDKAFILVRAVKWAESAQNGIAVGDYTLVQKYGNDGKPAYTVTYTGTEGAKPVWLAAAVYKDGALEDISLVSAQCAQNEPQTLMAETVSTDADEVKILLWDGAALFPLTDLVEG